MTNDSEMLGKVTSHSWAVWHLHSKGKLQEVLNSLLVRQRVPAALDDFESNMLYSSADGKEVLLVFQQWKWHLE